MGLARFSLVKLGDLIAKSRAKLGMRSRAVNMGAPNMAVTIRQMRRERGNRAPQNDGRHAR
jgi:hypothetical protein